jgi:MarR family protease production transcriptional regulator HPr
MESYHPGGNAAFVGALPLRDLYGKFPDIIEMMAIVRNIYGEDFMEIFERSFHNIETKFSENDGKLKKSEKTEHELS